MIRVGKTLIRPEYIESVRELRKPVTSKYHKNRVCTHVMDMEATSPYNKSVFLTYEEAKAVFKHFNLGDPGLPEEFTPPAVERKVEKITVSINDTIAAAAYYKYWLSLPMPGAAPWTYEDLKPELKLAWRLALVEGVEKFLDSL